MFKTIRNIMLVAVLMMLVISPANAVLVATMGAPDSSGNYPIEVDSDNYITVYGGAYAKYEHKTTSDTLTAAETGTTYVILAEQAWPATITLPDADVGLHYTFVSASADSIYLAPQSTDIFVVPLSGLDNTFTAGDIVYTQGYTGDSIEILCTKDLYWYVVDHVGTLADGN